MSVPLLVALLLLAVGTAALGPKDQEAAPHNYQNIGHGTCRDKVGKEPHRYGLQDSYRVRYGYAKEGSNSDPKFECAQQCDADELCDGYSVDAIGKCTWYDAQRVFPASSRPNFDKMDLLTGTSHAIFSSSGKQGLTCCVKDRTILNSQTQEKRNLILGGKTASALVGVNESKLQSIMWPFGKGAHDWDAICETAGLRANAADSSDMRAAEKVQPEDLGTAAAIGIIKPVSFLGRRTVNPDSFVHHESLCWKIKDAIDEFSAFKVPPCFGGQYEHAQKQLDKAVADNSDGDPTLAEMVKPIIKAAKTKKEAAFRALFWSR